MGADCSSFAQPRSYCAEHQTQPECASHSFTKTSVKDLLKQMQHQPTMHLLPVSIGGKRPPTSKIPRMERIFRNISLCSTTFPKQVVHSSRPCWKHRLRTTTADQQCTSAKGGTCGKCIMGTPNPNCAVPLPNQGAESQRRVIVDGSGTKSSQWHALIKNCTFQ